MADNLSKYAVLPLRFVAALSFLIHGLSKITDRQAFIGMLAGIGVPSPAIMSLVVAAVEVIGGIMLLVGFKSRLASIPMMGVILGSLFTVHLPAGFSFMNMTGMTEAGPTFGMPGFEVSLWVLAILGGVFLGGSGPLSIDNMGSKT